MQHDSIDLTLKLHGQSRSQRDILVSEDGDENNAVWLPLAQVEIRKRPNGLIEVSMSERLAIEKGLGG